MRKMMVVLAALMGLSGTAHAEVTTLSESGFWNAFGGAASDGSPICGIRTTWGSHTGFFVKWFSGNTLVVHLFKESWHVPQHMAIDVQFQFDHAVPWVGKAVGTANPSLIEIVIPAARVDTFLNEVRFANTVFVAFPTGTEAPWTGSMTGSNAAVATLLQCVHVVNDARAPQPYATTPERPSQPYQPSQSPLPKAVAPVSGGEV